jgi:hypothetical protein
MGRLEEFFLGGILSLTLNFLKTRAKTFRVTATMQYAHY